MQSAETVAIAIAEKGKERIKKNALAGNQTQIYCLEGSNANHYTTNASVSYESIKDVIFVHQKPVNL